MVNSIPLKNDYILEDSSDFRNPMAQMLMATIQTSSFVDMLTCSDEVQSFTVSFIASKQLQTERNIHPTEIPLHTFSSSENHSVQQNTATMALDQARFPLVSDEEVMQAAIDCYCRHKNYPVSIITGSLRKKATGYSLFDVQSEA